MAQIQMSGLVTAIAGSIGGTTIRRSNGSFIVYNKTSGASRNRLKSNHALSKLAKVRQAWLKLTAEQKKSWTDEAGTVTFPNKFKQNVHISGRMLFIKANGVLIIANKSIVNPLNYTKATIAFDIKKFEVDTTRTAAIVELSNQTDKQDYYFSFDIGTKAYRNPVYNRKMTIFVAANSHGNTISFSTEFFKNFPLTLTGDTIRVYITPVNDYGFRGNPITATATAI